MKVTIRPVHAPRLEIDLTHRLVSAIAEELWRLYGGNGELNWMEAERHLSRIVGHARFEAAESRVLLAPEALDEKAPPGIQRGRPAKSGRRGHPRCKPRPLAPATPA